MGFNFKNVFEQQLKEISVKTIGLFPGKFKPPHMGHFKTCEQAAKQNDIVLILISDKPHEGLTPDMSFSIWSIYKNYLPNKNAFVYITKPTPVLACYDLANILNNGEYKGTPPHNAPKSNINELISNCRELESYINVGNNIKLNVYSSQEDQQRFKNLKKSLYEGNNVLEINFKPVARVTSASSFRQAIKNKQNINKFLPHQLNSGDKQQIINILNDSI